MSVDTQQVKTDQKVDNDNQLPREPVNVEAVNERFYLRPKEIFAYTFNTFTARGVEAYNAGNLNFFQSSVAGLNSAQLQTKALVTSIWDAADDPISGFIIDRMRTRWGRLRPFLTLPVILGDVFTSLLFFLPGAHGTMNMTAYFAFVMVVTVLNSICASFSSGGGLLLYNITPSTTERTQLISVSKFFGEIGKWPVSIVKFLVSYLPKLSGNRINMSQIYIFAIIILGGLQAVSTMYYFFHVKERVPMPTKQQNKDNKIFQNIKLVFAHNKPMYILLLSGFLASVKNIAYANEDNFWLNCTGKISNGVICGLFTGIPKFVLIPLAPKIVKRFGVRRVAVSSGVFSGAAYGLLYAVGYGPFSSPVLNMIWITFMLTVAGIPNSLIDICNQLMTGDMYDYFEWKQGFRSEGLISAGMAYVNKFSSTVINWISAAVIGWINYVPQYDDFGNTVQHSDPKVRKGFFGVFALAPALARLGYGLACWFFPIHGEKKVQMLSDLDDMRREKIEKEEAQKRAEALEAGGLSDAQDDSNE